MRRTISAPRRCGPPARTAARRWSAGCSMPEPIRTRPQSLAAASPYPRIGGGGTAVCDGYCCIRISDQCRYLIVVGDCLVLTQFDDLERSFRCGLSELRIFQVWIRNTRLTCCSRSSDHLVVSLLSGSIRRQVTLQEATSPCFKVFAILPDLLSLPIGLEPTKHRYPYCTGFEACSRTQLPLRSSATIRPAIELRIFVHFCPFPARLNDRRL